MRGRIRFRSTVGDKIRKISAELSNLGIIHNFREVMRYEVDIQSQPEIHKFLDEMNWKANNPRKQAIVEGIRQYKNSPLG